MSCFKNKRDRKNIWNKHCLKFYLKQSGITLSVLQQMNFRDITKFEILSGLPVFYKEIISAYNFCRYIKPLKKMSNYEILTQIIWGN